MFRQPHFTTSNTDIAMFLSFESFNSLSGSWVKTLAESQGIDIAEDKVKEIYEFIYTPETKDLYTRIFPSFPEEFWSMTPEQVNEHELKNDCMRDILGWGKDEWIEFYLFLGEGCKIIGMENPCEGMLTLLTSDDCEDFLRFTKQHIASSLV